MDIDSEVIKFYRTLIILVFQDYENGFKKLYAAFIAMKGILEEEKA